MTDDAFQRLGAERRPWLDPAALKDRFLEQTAGIHPDRFHGAPPAEKEAATRRFAELNAAYNTLRESRERLILLLELERGSRPADIQRLPPGTMDLFVEVGQVCRDCDEFLRRRGEGTSPMLRLKHLQEGLAWGERLGSLQQRILARREALEAELREMNAVWEQAPPPGDPARLPALPLGRLEEIYRSLSYATRWTGQLQERVVQLAA